ncbi:vanadium-dependent haloperoxidase [uncultured Sphingomonas sp.]|uniref:vanadium-dependent haloperoxidase n=1 Tax=uncultured Sphingomonas sp. TaxID=158754 RepID=UPI0035CB2CDF
MRRLGVVISAALMAATPASADTVCEWIDYAAIVGRAVPLAPDAQRIGDHDRAQTQVALAMFEALNAIDRRYESYLKLAPASPTASRDAAAATAAYRVLLAHYPSQKAGLDDSYNVAMMGIADRAAREAGVLVGAAAAARALEAGGIDTRIVQTPYRPRTSAGVWTATGLPVMYPYMVAFTPWVLPRADAVRPPPPPALTSDRYARDFEEVKRLGARASTERGADGTLMARYRILPNMLPTLRLIADAPGRALVANARLFALMAMADDDAVTAVADAKLHYNFWRPITAIRNAQDDGNPATAVDPAWEPLISTPNHPEYPCGHCIRAAAAATVLKTEVGAAPPGGVRVTTGTAPSIVQVVPTFDRWVRDVSMSRTYGGVHYRFSNEAGEEMGRKVGGMAVAKLFRPLPVRASR